MWLPAQNLPRWNFYKQRLLRYYKNIPEIQNDINCHKILNTANPMNIQNHEKQRQIQNVPVYCFLHKIFHDETFINSGYRDITKKYSWNTKRYLLPQNLEYSKIQWIFTIMKKKNKDIIQNVPVCGFWHKIFHDETFINSSYRNITKIFLKS